jgi:hypothetical protein
MRYRLGLIGITLGFLLAAGLSYAQSKKDTPTTGTVHGVVVGLNGKPVYNAQVYLQPSGTTKQSVGITNLYGNFEFPNTPQGSYELKADRGNKESAWQHNVALKAGGDVNVTLKLDQDVPRPKPQGK